MHDITLTKQDKLYVGVIQVLVFFVFLIVLLPLVNLLAVSLSSPADIVGGKVKFLPSGFTLEPYKAVLTDLQFFTSLGNTALVTVAGAGLGLFLSVCAAYPLAKRDLPGRRWLMVLFVFTTMFSGGIIPSYLLVLNLNLINSLWALILPSSINVFNLLIAKSFFEGLPEEIEEAAKVDGASYFRTLLRIILPISGSMLATLFLFFAVAYWNEYFNAKLYITNSSKMTLQLYLRSILFEDNYSTFQFGGKGIDESMVSYQNVNNALIFCSMLPIALLYPFLQKYFVKGMTIGSVKG